MNPSEFHLLQGKPILLTELRSQIKTLFDSGNIVDYLSKGKQQEGKTLDYFKVRKTLENKLYRSLLKRQHVLDELVDEYLEFKGPHITM